jgi:nesprin-1
VRGLGEKVLPGTVESGQSNIRAQIDATQQDWQALLSAVASTIDALETTLANWTNFEAVKDVMQAWLRNIDNKLHAVNLRATLEEKKETLNELKEIQGEVRAKELEIDQLSEKAQSLNSDNLNGRSFQVKELTLAYQQLSNRVKDLCNKWQQFVGHHADYDSRVAECQNWLHDIKKKLTYCSDMTSTTEKELEKKLKTIQELLMCKEEGFTKVQSTVELAQLVLANTAPPGHDAINCVVEKLQQEWTAVAAKMVETKTYLDATINRWTGFLTSINQLKSSIEHVESALSDVSQFQSNLSEKRAQLERLKVDCHHCYNYLVPLYFSILIVVNVLLSKVKVAKLSSVDQDLNLVSAK